jgi:FixJ family two-component response regulator
VTGAAMIHVVDDDSSMRNALVRLLTTAGYEARGYASTGEFLLEASPARSGCLLLDVRLPGLSGLDLQAALRSKGITLPVVFLTGYADVASSVRAMKAGAVDFLTKPVKRDTLLQAIGSAVARDASRRAEQEEAGQLRERFAALTDREREIFDRIVDGKLNKEVAYELGIAERTVKLQRSHLMAKLGVRSAAELGRLSEQFRKLPAE